MMMHRETHRRERVAWLRAAVLGADDGIVSTASLILGVAASSAPSSAITIAGLAGLIAGAASMASGEYVSVSSQRDSEVADIEREKRELLTQPALEFEELKGIYVRRGLTEELARQVAERLMAVDRWARTCVTSWDLRATCWHARSRLRSSRRSASRAVPCCR